MERHSITIERINAAFDVYLANIDNDAYADRIREAQWSMVESGKADMDTAFVLSVEEAA